MSLERVPSFMYLWGSGFGWVLPGTTSFFLILFFFDAGWFCSSSRSDTVHFSALVSAGSISMNFHYISPR